MIEKKQQEHILIFYILFLNDQVWVPWNSTDLNIIFAFIWKEP